MTAPKSLDDWTGTAHLNPAQMTAPLHAKIAKQRSEIARLTQALEKATAEKARLLDDLKWMRGEE